MSKDEYIPLPDSMFPETQVEFDWAVPVHAEMGGDYVHLVAPEMATHMSDTALKESVAAFEASLWALQMELDYRTAAFQHPPPEGYVVVREGVSQEGDLTLYSFDPRLQAPIEWGPVFVGEPYWSLLLLVRPETT